MSSIRINGETVAITSTLNTLAPTEHSIEIEGEAAANLYLTESAQVDPAGRFRLRVSGGKLLVQEAERAKWALATDLLTLSESELRVHVPLDVSELVGGTNLIVGEVPPEVPDVVWLGDGNGPTEAPDGYLEIAVEQGTGYVPFWLHKDN